MPKKNESMKYLIQECEVESDVLASSDTVAITCRIPKFSADMLSALNIHFHPMAKSKIAKKLLENALCDMCEEMGFLVEGDATTLNPEQMAKVKERNAGSKKTDEEC